MSFIKGHHVIVAVVVLALFFFAPVIGGMTPYAKVKAAL